MPKQLESVLGRPAKDILGAIASGAETRVKVTERHTKGYLSDTSELRQFESSIQVMAARALQMLNPGVCMTPGQEEDLYETLASFELVKMRPVDLGRTIGDRINNYSLACLNCLNSSCPQRDPETK